MVREESEPDYSSRLHRSRKTSELPIGRQEDIPPETVVTGQVFHLTDSRQRQIGQITIERKENELIFGQFVPGPAFPSVEQLFRDFEEAVDAQALSVVDELDTAIAALGLSLRSPDGSQRIKIHDVQIWSDGDVTFRLFVSSCRRLGQNRHGGHATRPLAAKQSA